MQTETNQIRAQVLKNLQKRFPGVNFDLCGFKGLVDLETERFTTSPSLGSGAKPRRSIKPIKLI